ncbi:hydroxyethylthiazole kinase [Pasteurella langaaensis DSM 22999]|uniref:Hydroxyethylthiazole kinase n=1 Tax=Alitibacter langaaensis DSM 22999 TaxID=1122935 RepID=A0A2U0T8K2_9PAST|nr:hydroxyethylthiazole kinase [Pasteurella langaaensis]PVX39854.1 hydroxyethylthiazole kinase [Pasteurella langaaensis DSM 22999]
MQFKYLNLVRERNPLVHCMTNIVVANFSANGLLALGASPFMSTSPQEVAEIQTFGQALLINIGTLNKSDVDAMLIAGKAANQQGIPVVLDPVGAGATAYRRQVTSQLLSEIQFTAIRGNAAEIAFLANVDWQGKGVDAGQGEANLGEIARTAAQKYQCIVAVSGEIDYLSDGKNVIQIANGTPLFPKITGSGCLLGAVIAAFLGVVDKQDNLNAVVEACTVYALAGEIAAQNLSTQVGSFATAFLNQLAEISCENLTALLKLNKENNNA